MNNTNDARILVVDDEESLRTLLSSLLTDEGYQVTSVASAEEALELFEPNPYPVVLADIRLEGMSGVDLLKKIKKSNEDTQVLLITSHASLSTAIPALRAGAYDYIIKPFDPAEVVARVRVRLRDAKPKGAQANTARFEGWTAHFDRYVLIAENGDEISFSHAEGEVLRLFLDSPKRLISRQQMQETLGGAAGDSFDRAMDVRVSRLRTKLREDPKTPRLIKTIYGAGYIFLGDVVWG